MTDRSFSYFVIALDYPRSFNELTGKWRAACVEAIVNPEMTRRGAIEMVREVLGDGKGISFIHYITMNDVPQDVTAELIAEAETEMLEAAE